MTKFERVGFIGLGVMGGPMCNNVVAKGALPVWGCDRAPALRDALQGKPGFTPCETVQQVAEYAEIVLLSLPSIKEVMAVVAGPGGLLEKPGSVKLIVDMSTSAVKETRELAKQVQAAGIEYLDAPVARLRQAAQQGTLSIMVGGDAAVFEAARPILACMGTDITHCGGVGNGQVVKILNNMTVFVNANILAEMLAIGKRVGVEPELLFNTMALGSSDSFVLRNVGLKYLVPEHFPEQAFPTEYALKDALLALELARDAGIYPRLADSTKALLERTRDAGYVKEYYPIFLKLIEQGGAAAGQP